MAMAVAVSCVSLLPGAMVTRRRPAVSVAVTLMSLQCSMVTACSCMNVVPRIRPIRPQTDGEEVTTSSELFACAELPAKVVPAFPCTSPPVWCIISISSACSLLTTAPCCGRLGSDARRPTVGRPPGHQGTSAAALHSTRMRRAARWGLETSTVARSQPFTQSQSPTVAQSHLAQHS